MTAEAGIPHPERSGNKQETGGRVVSRIYAQKKRVLSLALALVMLLSCTDLGLVTRTWAEEGTGTTISLSKLLATTYGDKMSDEEQAVLESDLLASDSYSYVLPTDDDDLITVKTDDECVTLDDFENAVNTDNKVSFDVSVWLADEDEKEYPLTLSDGKYSYANLEQKPTSFTAHAKYEAKIEMGTRAQQNALNTLLNNVEALQTSVKNFDAVKTANGNLTDLQTALATASTMNMVNQLLATKAAQDAAAALTKNGSEFALTTALKGSATQELLKNNFYNTLKATYDNVTLIANDTTWQGIKALYVVGDKPADNATGLNLSAAKAIIGVDKWLAAVKDLLDVSEDTTEWPVLDTSGNAKTGLVRADMENTDYTSLDKLIRDLPTELKGVSNFGDYLSTGDSVTLEKGVARYTVTVNATLQKVDADNKLTDKYSSGSTTVTLNKGADKAAVETAIASFKSQMDSAAKTYYGEGNYDVSGYPELGDSFGLSKDETYTVTYSPKQYTVTDWDGNETNYYYGYQLTLPEHGDESMAYAYTADGTSYMQGQVYTVKGATEIKRTEGKANTFYQVVASNYFGSTSDADKKAAAILTSGALKGNYPVVAGYPGNDSVEIKDGKLTAKTVDSGYKTLTWKPYSYQLDGKGDEVLFDSTYTADLTGKTYNSVTVYYRLTLDGTADEALAAAQLPAKLATEAAAQKSALETLNGQYGNMEKVTPIVLNALKGAAESSTVLTSTQQTAYQTAFSNISARMEDNGKLKLYNLLTKYNEASDGLVYYYKNSGDFIGEVKALSENLDVLMENETTFRQFLEATLKGLFSDTEIESLSTNLGTLQTKLGEVKTNLTAPNAKIDTDSDKLSDLVKALNMTGDLEEVSTGKGDAFLTTSLEVAAPDKVMIVVTVSGGGNTKTASVSVPENAAITQEQVNTLKTNVNNAIAALGIQTNYYTNNYNSGAGLDDLVGEKPSEIDKGALAYTWTAIEYTVKIDGETDQTVTIEDGKIKLPKAEAGYKYTYTIGSNTTIVVGDSEDGSYTFGAKHFDDSSLFVGNTCTITRAKTNVSVDKLDKFVQSLNGTNGAITAKLSADRKTLTVTVDSGASGKKADMMSFALALVNNDYGYIGLKDEKDVSKAFIEKGEVSVQALLDALTLESTTIANVIDENGKVTTNNLLLTAPLQLGKDSAGNFEQELTLELRLAAEKQAPASLIPLRNLSSLATFKLSGGELDITLNLPQEVYEVYLAALLLTGTDLDDINKLDKKVAYKFLWDLTQPAVNGTDAETYKNTITNTLGALGKDEKIKAYLETYEGYVNKTLTYLNNALTFDENGYTMSLNASATRLNQLIEALLGDGNSSLTQFTSVVKELKEGGSVKVAVKADISNLDNRDYQALIFDRGEWNNGVKGKLDMIDLETNLADRLTEVKSTCGIILLKDIEAGLTFTTNTYLDLNGHKITGDVTVAAGAKLTVIDSSLATDSKAGIYGSLTVNGSLAILAGTYRNGESKTDVKTYLKNGYVQNDDGLVSNQYYTVVEDEKGNLTVELNADALNREITNKTFTAQLVKATALDICGDIFLNYYATAMLKVDDETIFDVGEFDLVELWKEPSTKDALITKAADVFDEYGITALTNKIVKELTSFAKVAENIENGEDIISFKLETAPWRVWLKHNTEGNYLDLAIGSNKSDASAASTASESAENTTNGVVSKTMNVAVKIVGNDEAKITKIANQFEKLSVIEVDAGIDYDDSETKTTFDIAYAEKTVKATGSAHADITVNLSEPEYAVVLGVILVSTADKNEIGDIVKADLVSGIQAYYNKEGVTKLKDAFDNVNVNNILKALAQLNYKDEDKTMKSMFTNLGFNDSQATAAATALGDTYYRLLDGFGWAVDIALDALGKSDAGSGYGLAGLAANAEKYGQYVADKQDVTRKATKTIAGYTFYCEMKASSVSITVNLFQSTVSFDAGEGGTGSMESVLVKTGETYKLPACTFTAPADKEFKCWSVGGVEKAVGDTITVNGPITITAVWQDKSAPTTYTVSGTVKSYDVEQSNVTVTLTDSENTVQTAITDESGKYEFTGIAAGTYTLSVTKSGCAKWTKTVAVTDNNVTENISIYLLGDVNLDGRVTEKDLIVLKRHLANAEKYPLSDEAKNVANINHDDAVSEKDVIVLKRYLANSIKYSLG